MDQIAEPPVMEERSSNFMHIGGRSEVDTTLPYETVKQAVTIFGGLADKKTSPIHLSRVPHTHTERWVDDDPELLHAFEELTEASKLLEVTETERYHALQELATQQNILEEVKQRLEKALKDVVVKVSSEPVDSKEHKESDDLNQTETNHMDKQAELNRIKTNLEFTQKEFEKAKEDMKTLNDKLQNSANLRLSSFQDIKATEVLAQSILDKIIQLLKEKLQTMLTVADPHKLTSNEDAEVSCEGEHNGASNLKLTANVVIPEVERMRKELENNQSLLSHGGLNSIGMSEADHAATLLNFKVDPIQVEKDLEKAILAESAAVARAAGIVEEMENVRETLTKMEDQNATLSAELEGLQKKWNMIQTEMETTKEKEKTAAAATSALKAELKKIKPDLSEALGTDLRSKEAISSLTAQLQEASIEADKAKILKKKSLEEIRTAKMAAEQATAATTTVQLRLQAAYKETEAIQASQSLAIADSQALLQKLKALALDSGTDSPQFIQREQYDSLFQKLQEAEERAMMSISGIIYMLNEQKAAEQELFNELKEANVEVEASRQVLLDASKNAEAAEAEKVLVEGELRRWRAENVRRRHASDVSSMASPIVALSGRSLHPETPEQAAKTDHFAQVQQLTFPNPVEKVHPPVEAKIKAVKKPKLFARLKSFFFKRRNRSSR